MYAIRDAREKMTVDAQRVEWLAGYGQRVALFFET